MAEFINGLIIDQELAQCQDAIRKYCLHLIQNHCHAEPEDLIENIIQDVRHRFLVEQELRLNRIFINRILWVLGDALKYITEQQKKLACIALRVRVKCTEKVKSLHKPFQVIPHSLHPDELAAY